MPKIEIPKITKPIHLSDYDQKFGDQTIEVWVNPPRALLSQGEQLSDSPDKIFEWYAPLWFTNGEPWSMTDVQALFESCFESDPAFWVWIQRSTLTAISEHRAGQRKN